MEAQSERMGEREEGKGWERSKGEGRRDKKGGGRGRREEGRVGRRGQRVEMEMVEGKGGEKADEHIE